MRSYLSAFLIVLATATSSRADIVGSFVVVPTEGGQSPPSGFVTSDLSVHTTTDWLGANLTLELTAGSIYQDALLAGIGPPSPALINVFPVLRFDTYVTGSSGIAGGPPSSAGGAVDLGGDALAEFGEDALNINWFTTSTADVGSFTIGRFTLSNDAVGVFALRLDSLQQTNPFLLSGSISAGQFVVVPEISSVTLLAGAGMLFISLQWCRQALRTRVNWTKTR